MTKEELIIGFFEKGYCCDLDEVKDTCLGLLKENQELKNQLEDKDDFINKLQETKNKLDKWDYKNTLQQAKFIKYLEDEIKKLKERDIYQPLQRMALATLEHNLQKFKEIVNSVEQH